MARKNRELSVVTAQGMLDVVDGDGKVVSSIPVTPERVIDILDIEKNPAEGVAKVTSLTTGATLTMGYTPEYARGYEHAFGPRGRSQSRN